MALNLTKTVFEYLRENPEQRFLAREIAEWVFETYPEECRQKQKRSKATVSPLDTKQALLQQLVAEIGSQRPRLQKQYPKIKVTEGRPRKYYYSESTDSEEITHAESQSTSTAKQGHGVTKQGLYQELSDFLWSELKVYSKRIDEKRSSNSKGKKGNHWLHPDLVGLEDLSGDWHTEIKGCVKEYADKKTKLWSFEVKILINRSNLREAFFQTVSNSSWANFGYLVANEISGADTLKELRMLSSLHGIGFISLSVGSDSESQIMIPAKERTDIDWDTVNRMTNENKDFRGYIRLIRQFYQTGDIRDKDWDAKVGEQ